MNSGAAIIYGNPEYFTLFPARSPWGSIPRTSAPREALPTSSPSMPQLKIYLVREMAEGGAGRGSTLLAALNADIVCPLFPGLCASASACRAVYMRIYTPLPPHPNPVLTLTAELPSYATPRGRTLQRSLTYGFWVLRSSGVDGLN